MRVTKKYDVRHKEILDAAEELFVQTGYEKTTINNILDKVGIGKGTFYHYFTSKEEVVNAVINRVIQYIVEKTVRAFSTPDLNATEKMQLMMDAANISGSPHFPFLDSLGIPANALLHQKFAIRAIKDIAPIFANVVNQGIEEGVYTTKYPLETMEVIIAANQIIFNGTIMHMSAKEQETRGAAFIHIMEVSLGAAKDSLSFLA